MTRTTLRSLLLVLAAVCFLITALTTEHALTAAASGLTLGYVLGLMCPYAPKEARA